MSLSEAKRLIRRRSFERESCSRASYYPGSKTLKTRIVVEPRTRRLLGAQMVGEEGVVGRIDALATALFARMTVDEVHNLDLAYAPPFGPIYDAIIDVCGKPLNYKPMLVPVEGLAGCGQCGLGRACPQRYVCGTGSRCLV